MPKAIGRKADIMKPFFDNQDPPETPAWDYGDEPADMHAGFSGKAIQYIREKPHWGVLPDADQVTEMTGSCGDTMTVYLKIDQAIITEMKVLVLGCAGAVSAAMAAVDLVLGKSLAQARAVDDGDIFKALAGIPAEKHHCIQLSVRTLHRALDDYEQRVKA